MDSFGTRLVKSRENKNLNQKELAKLLGISPTRLNYWEKDKREPDVAMIKSISRILCVSANYLIGLCEHQNQTAANSHPPTQENIDLTPEEIMFLHAFRNADDGARQVVRYTLERFIPDKKGEAPLEA